MKATKNKTKVGAKKMIVIGSQSLLIRLPQTPSAIDRRKKADFDVIMYPHEFTAWVEQNKPYIQSLVPRAENKYKASVMKDGVRKQYEIELGIEGTSSKYLLDNESTVTYGYINGFLGERYEALNLFFQAMTKRSHLIYPVHFEKNMEDYHMLLHLIKQKHDLDLDYKEKPYYQLRFQEGKERYNQRTPNLDVSNEDFFSSKLAVERYFVHDHIHEMVKHYDQPIYEMMKRDMDKAWCEKDMFFELPLHMQVQCVQEEAYTIALERYIVPAAQDWEDHYFCYKKAVKRICTTLTSGWFRDFAIENYPKILAAYDPTFVTKFYNKFEAGEIQLVEGKTMSDLPYYNK